MKKLLFFISILVVFNGIGQNVVDKIVSHGNRNFSIMDSSLVQLGYEEIQGFNFEFYSAHIHYMRPNNGNLINLNVYRDSIIYFEEQDNNQHFISGGEMRINTMQTYLLPNVFMNYDDNGNQVYLPDTLDTWKQDGIWKTPIGTNMTLHTLFKMGNVENEQLIITAYCDEIVKVELDKTAYHLDTNSNEVGINLPEQEVLETLVSGYWYHPACSEWIYNDNPIWVFLKNKPDSYGAYGDRRVVSNFLINGQYEGKNKFSCGTGRSKEDYNPTATWEITEKKELKIGERIYKICYIDKEMMLVQQN